MQGLLEIKTGPGTTELNITKFDTHIPGQYKDDNYKFEIAVAEFVSSLLTISVFSDIYLSF